MFSVDCERRSIPFLPFKRTEKDAQGNESKKGRLEGGGGSNKEEKRTQCNSCGKYHLGICDPTRGKSSSSSSSSKTNPGHKYDKYKSPDANKKQKRKLPVLLDSDNDIEILQQEERLNKLSESSYACQYPMKISTTSGKYIDIIALIDTGANASNYISQTMFDRLKDAGYKAQQTSGSVRGGLNVKGQRVDCTMSMSFPLQFISEQCSNDSCNAQKCCKLTIINTNLIAKLLPIDYDLIVGLPSIRELELIKHLPSLFLNENKPSIGDSGGRSAGVYPQPIFAANAEGGMLNKIDEVVITDPPFSPSGTIWEDNEVETRYEQREIPGIYVDQEIPDGGVNNKTELLNQIDYGDGTPTLKEKLRKLCYEFKDIIDDKLSDQPAKVDQPMEVDVEEGAWFNNPGNRRPSRAQSAAKQHEIRRQIQKMIANRLIQPSQAKAWSQVLLVRKPDSRWRFCVDYRNINAITRLTSGHPLPNIKEMLHRLGEHKARYYATIDLTSGYFQTPVAETAQLGRLLHL